MPQPAVRAIGDTASDVPDVEIRVHDHLTSPAAFALCLTVRDRLQTGARALALNLESVKATDVTGLAALRESVRLAALFGVQVSILPSAHVYRAFLDAQLLEELPLVGPRNATTSPSAVSVDLEPLEAPVPYLACGSRVGLRQPTWDELALFQRWARDPLLDQMVGSEFLYRCRHLGPYHPDFVASALSDATALTLLVEPLGATEPPVGFVRLYNIRLAEQFGFLETAVADLRSARKGWGIEASRLLLAYAMDVLGIRRAEAKVYAYNVLSINALRRNGFRQEGALRQARTYEGQRWDILVFSILEDEMLEQRRQERFPYMGFWR